MSTPAATAHQEILLHALAYLLWLVITVISIVAVLEFRTSMNAVWVMAGHSYSTLGLMDQVCVLAGGLAAFIYCMFLQSYYGRSVGQPGKKEATRVATPPEGMWRRLKYLGLGVLLRRFAWTIAVPIGLLIVSLIARQLAFRIPQ